MRPERSKQKPDAAEASKRRRQDYDAAEREQMIVADERVKRMKGHVKAEQRLGKKWMGQAPISFSMEKGNDFHADVQVSRMMHWLIWIVRT